MQSVWQWLVRPLIKGGFRGNLRGPRRPLFLWNFVLFSQSSQKNKNYLYSWQVGKLSRPPLSKPLSEHSGPAPADLDGLWWDCYSWSHVYIFDASQCVPYLSYNIRQNHVTKNPWWTLDMAIRNSAPEEFTCIWQSKWVGIIVIEISLFKGRFRGRCCHGILKSMLGHHGGHHQGYYGFVITVVVILVIIVIFVVTIVFVVATTVAVVSVVTDVIVVVIVVIFLC